MRVLVTGICGFVGSTLARTWVDGGAAYEIVGVDSLIRGGSEVNRQRLRHLGIDVRHADIRSASDVDALPTVDWVVDAAANPSVLAGVDGTTSSRQLLEHNLGGTINLLEYCKRHGAGLILLSTSRVYSLHALESIAVEAAGGAFVPLPSQRTAGVTAAGIDEAFPTTPPVSLYGAAKIASELLALEYGDAFGFPVWINRCGVLAGAEQFGKPDQGIVAFWIRSWALRRPLKYIGFDGAGHQVRDVLHPRDLVPLLERQMSGAPTDAPRVVNVSGGSGSAFSLRQLSDWCRSRFGAHAVVPDARARRFDAPWIVLDASLARRTWRWQPATPRDAIFDEIAAHAVAHPEWLELSRD